MTPSLPSPLLVVTGPFGLVGRSLIAAAGSVIPLARSTPPSDLGGGVAFPRDIPRADVTDDEAVSRVLEEAAKRATAGMVVVHLAALTDTWGEGMERFRQVNVGGTSNVMKAADRAGAGFIHISTDYVFSGETDPARVHTEKDRPGAVPAAPYAASKREAEDLVLDAGNRRHAVVRLASPYGDAGPRAGLAEKLIGRFEDARRQRGSLALFNDQKICPSYLPDVSRGMISLARRLLSGLPEDQKVFHLVGPQTTPYDFARLLQKTHSFEDVSVTATSVSGSRYCGNLHLSSNRTRDFLSWRPTPHEEALSQMASGGKDNPA